MAASTLRIGNVAGDPVLNAETLGLLREVSHTPGPDSPARTFEGMGRHFPFFFRYGPL